MCPLTTDLGRQWERALAPVNVRYPDPEATPFLRLWETTVVGLGLDPGGYHVVPRLEVGILGALDSLRDGWRIPELMISTVELTYFPGERLARAWLAAGWSGYLQHEALELVTVGDDLGERALDPHKGLDVLLDRPSRMGIGDELGGPWAIPCPDGTEVPTFAHDLGIRLGFPPVLTRETLIAALTSVMSPAAAVEFERSVACAS